MLSKYLKLMKSMALKIHMMFSVNMPGCDYSVLYGFKFCISKFHNFVISGSLQNNFLPFFEYS